MQLISEMLNTIFIISVLLSSSHQNGSPIMFESKDGCNTGKEENEISHGKNIFYYDLPF